MSGQHTLATEEEWKASVQLVSLVNILQPEPTRNTLVVEQVGFSTCCSKGKITLWGTMVGVCFSKRMLERTYRMWVCVGEGLRKQGFALNWVL